MRARILLLALPLLATILSPAAAQEAQPDPADIAAGKTLAEANCAICHAIGPAGASTLKVAPPFRDIALMYDPEELEDAFNEGVPTDHPAMPDWQMTPDQARQLAAYIMSLRDSGKLRSELGKP
ncbi:MAG: cytochrome c [Proteobacteria bacterium]|nr:cytochrome c [Pseudomonadota bacterium]